MDADEYYATRIAKVASNWAWYTSGTVEFLTLLREGLSRVGPSIPGRNLLIYEYRRQHNKAVLARRKIDNGFPTVNNHILVDTWGAFESFIEDVCSAALTANPSLVERAEDIVSEFFNKVHRVHKLGLDKLKIRLKLVSLECSASEELESRVKYAQQLRHAIVHNGSVADEKFVERCGHYSQHMVGEKLTVSGSMLKELIGALIVYGLLIVNNDRAERGAPPALGR
jgi:hypothetical protein